MLLGQMTLYKIKVLYYIGYKNNNREDYMDILEARKEKILAFLKSKGYPVFCSKMRKK